MLAVYGRDHVEKGRVRDKSALRHVGLLLPDVQPGENVGGCREKSSCSVRSYGRVG